MQSWNLFFGRVIVNETHPQDLDTTESELNDTVNSAPGGGGPRPPVPTDAESIDMVAAAEARIATSMAFFLELILQKICIIRDPAEQAEIIKDIFCAYACKEKGMAAVFNALANKILADKGLVPGADSGCC